MESMDNAVHVSFFFYLGYFTVDVCVAGRCKWKMDVVIYWGFVWISLFCMVLVKAYELPPFVLGFNSNLFEKWMRLFFLRKNNIKIWVLGPVEWSICCCCFFIMYILLNENRHYYFYSFVYFNVQFTDYFELHLLKSVQGSTTPKQLP